MTWFNIEFNLKLERKKMEDKRRRKAFDIKAWERNNGKKEK